jgi:hypothetical protein
MIAEARTPLATNDAPPTMVLVQIEVEVTYNPTGIPAFKFYGLGPNHSVFVEAPTAIFVLTLSPIGFDGAVTFAPVTAETDGPISWFTPGSGDPIVRPDFVSYPELSQGSTVLTFTDTNTASGQHDLVGFAVNIEVASPSRGLMFFTSRQPYSSPDPTIINVDPTGPPPTDA